MAKIAKKVSKGKHVLTGEEYASDGVWLPVIIKVGTYSECVDTANVERFMGQYRDLQITPEDYFDYEEDYYG